MQIITEYGFLELFRKRDIPQIENRFSKLKKYIYILNKRA